MDVCSRRGEEATCHVADQWGKDEKVFISEAQPRKFKGFVLNFALRLDLSAYNKHGAPVKNR